MKKSNIILGIGIGFIVLGVVAIIVDIPTQTLTILSICSLMFSVAQTLHSYISLKSESNKKMVEAFNSMQSYALDEKVLLFFKKYIDQFTQGRKEKTIEMAGNALEAIACVVMVAGIAIPIPWFEGETVSRICSFFSFGSIFISMWLLGLAQKKVYEWEEMQLFALLFKSDNITNNTVKECVTDGQA